eukprot:6193483-Pleurochrysis_carterae.AAC.1
MSSDIAFQFQDVCNRFVKPRALNDVAKYTKTTKGHNLEGNPLTNFALEGAFLSPQSFAYFEFYRSVVQIL